MAVHCLQGEDHLWVGNSPYNARILDYSSHSTHFRVVTRPFTVSVAVARYPEVFRMIPEGQREAFFGTLHENMTLENVQSAAWRFLHPSLLN